MKRLIGSLVATCAFLVAASPSIAATTHCSTSDFAMQCVHVPAPAGTNSALVHGTAQHVYKYGVDFGWRNVSAATAYRYGARFGASYLSSDWSKNWSASLLRSYHALGMATVAVWETTATRALSGYSAGRADASSALSQERTLGIPTSKPVYFAVDFDETPGQAAAVANYFRGVDSVLGVSRTGGYGGYWVVSRLFNAGVIRYGWQTYAWSGGNWDPRAQLQQYNDGSTFDWDRAMTPYYGGTH